METLTAGLYIEKKVVKTRTLKSDGYAEGTSRNFPGSSLECLAEESASLGEPEVTASFLIMENRLPYCRRGEIMALAFNRRADMYEEASKCRPMLVDKLESYKKTAAESRKSAQEFTRAAQRSKKS